MNSAKLFLLVCPLVFLAGFVDSIAGGGGLISLPAYMMAGLPTHLAAGTNKFAACIGTCASAAKYLKSGKVKVRWSLLAAVGAVAGSAIGTRVAQYLNDRTLRIIILCVMPVMAAIIVFKRSFGAEERVDPPFKPQVCDAICVLIGLVIGCYDGLVGPGTGTLMIMAFTGILKIDLLTASGCAKIGNLASNVAALTLWIIKGQVLFAVAVPAAVCSIAGNYLGSMFAIKGGAKRVRWVMLAVVALVFIKLTTELIKG